MDVLGRWTILAVVHDSRRAANARVLGPMVGPGDEPVEVVPAEQLRGAVAENEQLRADLTRVRGQRDALIEHEHVMTAEIDRLRAGG